VQLNDQDVQAMVWLGQAWQNKGDRAKAGEWYNRALKVDPNQPDAKKGLQILQAPPKGGTK
jgi:tetratricopeptide (TPR) repeat protein